MKACLLYQRRFTRVAHEIAKRLRDDYGVTEFCGYVYLHSSYDFLKNQKDISYSSLILDEEIHERYKTEKVDWDYLKKIEQEYGIPNLWPYISVDRTIRYDMPMREYPYDTPKYTHEDMARIFQV